MNPIELSLFASQITAVCEEMGAVLRRAAFSTNIRDRLDYSCAVFDPAGRLCAQAAHIPVHLGSMAYAMHDLVARFDWAPGDMVIVNDPYLGGTHLPDVTVLAPVFAADRCIAFVANRAHHADIGAGTPGSMPVSSSLDEEGIVIAPTRLQQAHAPVGVTWDAILARTANPQQMQGDLAAQVSANLAGAAQLVRLAGAVATDFQAALDAVNDYAARLARHALAAIPDGRYRFTDTMDDDGQGNTDIAITATVSVEGDRIDVDFSGTAAQVAGNINCPLPVTAAAVYYVFRCLMPAQTPACAGSFDTLHLHAPAGCLLHAARPAAVAAGNVETSSRVVDVIMGALAQAIPDRIPAASQGSMNNLAMGARAAGAQWDYYETMAGGTGGGAQYPGLHAVQSHMTNTLNTPIEVLEMAYPVRVLRYAVRSGSGGRGRHAGGDGLLREYEFLSPATVTVLSERRRQGAWGLQSGHAGRPGRNRLDGEELPGKFSRQVQAGARLAIETPGGGGWGAP